MSTTSTIYTLKNYLQLEKMDNKTRDSLLESIKGYEIQCFGNGDYVISIDEYHYHIMFTLASGKRLGSSFAHKVPSITPLENLINIDLESPLFIDFDRSHKIKVNDWKFKEYSIYSEREKINKIINKIAENLNQIK